MPAQGGVKRRLRRRRVPGEVNSESCVEANLAWRSGHSIAVLLARLAVDAGFQSGGIGSKLLVHALRQIAEASLHVGFEVVVVHAIDQDAVAFYAQRGFTRFEDHDLHLFMPVKNLLATLGPLSN